MPGRLPDPRRIDRTELDRRFDATGSAERPDMGVQPTDGERPYEEWTITELRAEAVRLGVVDHPTMHRDELIDALRTR